MTWTFTPLTFVSALILALIWAQNYLVLRRLAQHSEAPQRVVIPHEKEELPYLTKARQAYEEGFE